MYQIHIKRTHN